MTQLNEVLGNAVLDPALAGAIHVEAVRFYRARETAKVVIASPRALSYQEFIGTRERLKELCGCRVFLEVHSEVPDVSVNDIYNYFEFFKTEHPDVNALFSGTMHLEDHTVTFVFNEEQDAEHGSAYIRAVKCFLDTVGLSGLKLECSVREKEKPAEEIVLPAYVPEKKAEPKDIRRNGNNKYRKKKRDEYAEISLKDVSDSLREIQFAGKVFAVENYEVRTTKRLIQSVSVFDGNDAIIVKQFEGKNFSREDLAGIKTGMYIRVFGNITYDTYARDLVCEAEEVRTEDAPVIKDNAEVKRVELHMHTNMSEMDGICDAKSIINYVHQLGHHGVVITDHADVQSFVKAFNEGQAIKKKDPDFKVGLGCEVNLAEDHLQIVTRPTDQLFDEAEYVAFDLETTGLSCYYDHIIEFGAVRLRGRNVVDRLQMFVKPPVPIPGYITRKTNITNDMVRDAKPFAEVCDEIVSWLGDSVLVAHNAEFDINFLNEELRRLGKPVLNNTYIDTLDMSRAILRDRRTYRLGNISRNYHVAYDEEVAHRADYDAEALSLVFLGLLRDAENMGAKTLRDLQEKIQDDHAFEKVRHSHTVLIAKNLQGLKDLYRLVSMSNTKTLQVIGKVRKNEDAELPAEPRMLRSAINAVRENLYIGTSCPNNEVFELACNGDDERLRRAMSWYDYVELQPLSNYSTLIALGNVPNKERLKEVILRMIRMAKELNIPVVADSDAHYCTPDQKIFRDVYIMSQGVGGTVHPLFIRDDNLRMRTKNPDMHIRLTNEMKEEFG
ncbi:MAG: PHP domain-containing protein [Solobacterium sp.]|nr:PHP domain-containing protein [Solobacterium sp.]